MIATMDLAPVTTSKLEGRTRAWGKELSVVDSASNDVIEVRLGTVAKPPHATVRTAQGEWRVDRFDPFRPPGPKRTGLDGGRERLDLLDSDGNIVATKSGYTLTLADGEELTWDSTACGLGDGLWTARAHWPRRRGFRAEVAERCSLVKTTGFLPALRRCSLRRLCGAAELTAGPISPAASECSRGTLVLSY